MLESLKKGILAGIGLGLTTKEKIEEYAKKAAEEAKLSKEEGEKFLKDLLKQSEEAKKSLDKKIRDGINAAMTKSGVVPREEYEKLEKRVEKLEKLLAAKKNKTGKTK
ncbi:MAG TPA: hypothetical protein ENK25_11580 [Bacteroidetes bacterium]|nr:hypothetical protein [Bacteroidota bacterium]